MCSQNVCSMSSTRMMNIHETGFGRQRPPLSFIAAQLRRIVSCAFQ